MTAVASLRDVALLRLAAQRLVGEAHPTAADAARWATCTQAQDLPGALVSLALRTRERTVAGVDAALDAGAVVRSWPMRGTLHLVAAEDLRWLLAVGPPRVAAAAAKRRADLGIDEAVMDAARAATVAALEGDGRLPRDQLMTVWDKAGVSTAGQRGAHVFGALAVEGLVCLGPLTGRRQQVVLVDEWVAPTPARDRDEAVQEWALRYFRGHGPATERDFAWWSGLTLTEARRAAAVVRDELAPLVVGGVEHLMDPDTPARLDGCRREARGVLLVPGFDELVLGYGDRAAVVPPEHSDRVAPGGNGMFLATVVSAGTAVATWRRPTSRAATEPDVTPFGSLTKPVAAAVRRRWAAYPRPA